jgi:hypothetical protein
MRLLFLGPYPTKENIRDGMLSRIASIDERFSSSEREYVDISLIKFRRKAVTRKDKVTAYSLNLISHFFLILGSLRHADIIYLHSVHSIKYVFPVLFFLKKRRIILDAHGIVPEEEKYYKDRLLIYLFYSVVENVIFKLSDLVVCVTDAMKKHFQIKYPKYKGAYFVLPNIPSNMKDNSLMQDHLHHDNTVIIYSGGISPWQNIDLMLDIIERNQSKNYKFIILSGYIDVIRSKIDLRRINPDIITLDNVDPSCLSQFYQQSDYGFILREDNPVNHVANPTKLVEYLNYGLVPIVLSERLGDFFEMGMEYVKVKGLSLELPKPRRSIRNIQLISKLRRDLEVIDYSQVVVNSKKCPR